MIWFSNMWKIQDTAEKFALLCFCTLCWAEQRFNRCFSFEKWWAGKKEEEREKKLQFFSCFFFFFYIQYQYLLNFWDYFKTDCHKAVAGFTIPWESAVCVLQGVAPWERAHTWLWSFIINKVKQTSNRIQWSL